MDKEWLTQRFDILRKERGWSKCKLSEEAGLSSGMVYQWYNTDRMPTIKNIEMICKACNITLSEFFVVDKRDAEELFDVNFSRFYQELSFEDKKFIMGVLKEFLKLKKNNG